MPKTEPDAARTINITIEARHISEGDPWLSKEEIARLEQEGLKYWNEATDDTRNAVIVLCRDALLRLIEDPDLWIPTSVTPQSGNRLGVWIMMHLAEVDDEVVRRRVETERELHNTREDLVALHGELGAGDDPST
jgi:hypothetical protein